MRINIGLTDTNGNTVPLHEAFAQAAKLGAIVASKIQAGETEDCLAVEFKMNELASRDWTRALLTSACNALKQDCIAVVWQSGEGELVGPNSAAWGAFNPDFFIQPN